MPTIVVEVPACFDPVGWQWAYYSEDYSPSDQDNNLTPAENFQTTSPDVNGTTPELGYTAPSGTSETIYDTQLDTTSFAINQRSYIKATQSGQYNLTLSRVDDRALLWLGDDAYTGYTNDNRDAEYRYTNADGYGSGSTLRTFEAGDYIPIRVLSFNRDGGTSLAVSITGPDGNELGDDAFVQYGCDPSNVDQAPPFHDFGDEA